MTAPALAGLLDRLKEAREAALPKRSLYPSPPWLELHETDRAAVEAVWSDGARSAFVDCYEPEDAELIVESLNAVETLAAAVRAVEELRLRASSRGVPVVGVDELAAALSAAVDGQPT